jgi:hypothetical protein
MRLVDCRTRPALIQFCAHPPCLYGTGTCDALLVFAADARARQQLRSITCSDFVISEALAIMVARLEAFVRFRHYEAFEISEPILFSGSLFRSTLNIFWHDLSGIPFSSLLLHVKNSTDTFAFVGFLKICFFSYLATWWSKRTFSRHRAFFLKMKNSR